MRSVLDIEDAVKDLMKSKKVMIELGRAMGKQMPRIAEIADKVTEDNIEMQKTLDAMVSMVKGDWPITASVAMKFLDTYSTFNPSVTPQLIAEYEENLDVVVTTACDALANADSVVLHSARIFQDYIFNSFFWFSFFMF